MAGHRLKLPRLYSYLRFSTPEQKKGDSRRRQDDLAEAWARKNGYTLYDQMADEGLSGYHGTHRKRGKLRDFLKLVEDGKVPRGSILLVENIDRLSREEPVEALQTIVFGLISKGIILQTLYPEATYDRDAVNDYRIYELLGHIKRAHEESRRKSDLSRTNWKQKRKLVGDGQRMATKRCPAWLRLSQDRKTYEEIPDAVKAVRLIFQWAGEGLGITSITERLNKGTPSITKKGKWVRSYVASILRDRSVLGEFTPCIMTEEPIDPDKPEKGMRRKPVPQGEPVKDYFPRIVSDDQWYRVRKAVNGRGETKGRQGDGVTSLFTGILFNARDNAAMHISYSCGNKHKALIPYSSINCEVGSERLTFNYPAFETAFLRIVKEVTVEDITNKSDTVELDIASLTGKVEELDRKMATIKSRVHTSTAIDVLLNMIEELDREKKDTLEELDKLKGEMASDQPTALTETQSLIDQLDKVQGEEHTTLRLKVKAKVRQMIAGIWMLVWDATPNIRSLECQVFFQTGKVKAFTLMWFRQGKFRGHVAGGGGSVVQPARLIPAHLDLRRYHDDPKVREAFDRRCAEGLTATLAYEQAHAAVVKAGEAVSELEE